MPYWYYDKKELRNTPSIQDGIDYETECRYRKEGARFIIDTGTKMDLGYNTMATGVVYFHRFYMFHSFRAFPRYVTACCCLFLAGKVEETPKKCKDIIRTARGLLTEQKFLQFGEDPKEEVMTLERILLQTIKFDLQVEHPYQYLLKYAKALQGDKVKLQKMVQMAWTFVNDSLCTTLSLQWEPEILAVALMYLASKLSKFEVETWHGRKHHHLRWWDLFVEDITMDLLEDICHQVLDLYSKPKVAPPAVSPPMGASTIKPIPPPSLKRAVSSNPDSPGSSKVLKDEKIDLKSDDVKLPPDMLLPPPHILPPVGPPPTNVPPPNMYQHPPPNHHSYPPPLMGPGSTQAHPQLPPFHFSNYVMPHQPPTLPGQAPYFRPPYYEK
ncbi:cyclin-K isoform X2 [Neocloeon triangulifer]|uniref:cyclin-K isoform X2 n=1 Tax=Neocloeon triangulifer TaxID=2078957 RepID=UPI00286EDC41|nr:cyclin-K isoform X2 [Neocloeon triangulifer]